MDDRRARAEVIVWNHSPSLSPLLRLSSVTLPHLPHRSSATARSTPPAEEALSPWLSPLLTYTPTHVPQLGYSTLYSTEEALRRAVAMWLGEDTTAPGTPNPAAAPKRASRWASLRHTFGAIAALEASHASHESSTSLRR